MATLTSQQLKDSYQSLVTIGDSITSNPTSGQLENGKGTPLTAVGIGTDSPSADLTVTDGTSAGTLSIGNDSASTSVRYLQFGETNDYSIQSNANSYLRFYAEGAERMRIHDSGDISFRDGATNEAFYWDASAGSLGIGTSSPKLSSFLDAVLTVGSTSSGQQGGLELLGNITSDTVVSALTFNNQASGTADKRIAQISAGRDGDNNSGSLGFTVYNGVDSAVSAMVMDSSGNVGIGTTSPDSKLHVAGTTPTLTINDTTEGSWVVGDKLGTVSFRTSDGSGVGAREVGFIHIENEQAGTTMSGAMVFGSSAYNASATERMRILSGGGITFNGDTAAANALDDYEEGTFDVTTAGDATGAFSSESGKYVKIGKFVEIHIAFDVSTNFTSTSIGGIPFVADASLVLSSIYGAGLARTQDASTPFVNFGINNNNTISFENAPNTTDNIYRLNFTLKTT